MQAGIEKDVIWSLLTESSTESHDITGLPAIRAICYAQYLRVWRRTHEHVSERAIELNIPERSNNLDYSDLGFFDIRTLNVLTQIATCRAERWFGLRPHVRRCANRPEEGQG